MHTIIQPLRGSVVFISFTIVLTGLGIRPLGQKHEHPTESKERIKGEVQGSRQRALDLQAMKNQAGESGGALGEGSAAESPSMIKSFVNEIEITCGDVVMKRTFSITSERSRWELATLAAWGPGQSPGGDRGTRTPNLGIANAALSQLSYIPTCGTATDYSNETLLLQRARLRCFGASYFPPITYNYTFVRRCNPIAHAWSAML